jgi:carbonic anhydrase
VQLAGASAAALAAGPASPAPAARRAGQPQADEVLRQLLEGNKRFVEGKLEHPGRKPEDFRALAEGQSPHAVILGCADSRVPPELLFDQAVGDLFVVRVAGNVVLGAGAAVKGSIEYAVAVLNVPLVLVLGHSQCGAVEAALKRAGGGEAAPGAIKDLVGLIQTAADKVKDRPGDKLGNAIRANVAMGVERLRTLPPVLAERVKDGRLKVAGAVYDLRTGRVEVLP